MHLLNATGMQAGYTMGRQPDGRELLVVVVKGTFSIPPDPSQEPRLAEEQAPLIEADGFTGEPGLSAPLYETDYAPRKPRCDVLLNGSAYAPGGKPTTRVTVALQVGSLRKSFDVVGNRSWKSGILTIGTTEPAPFTMMPISYNNAFGGVDRSQADPAKHRWYPTNHAGVGYHEYLEAQFIDGRPLPNTEETGRRVTDPRGKYRPMAFGPVGRAWQPRLRLAGTYDEAWFDRDFPFLPADFDERYHQAAPTDQQIDYPRRSEPVELRNLTPRGIISFELPGRDLPVLFFPVDGAKVESTAVVDTVILEPDQGRFVLVWRSSMPLSKNLFEISQAVVGEMPQSWHRARARGKTHHRSLAELVASKRDHDE